MIIDIKTEGTSFLYVTEPLTDELNTYKIRFSKNVYAYYEVSRIDNVRLILDEAVGFSHNNTYIYRNLYWLDSKNLDELDQKVKDGNYTDTDFENSIKCEFHNGERCPECGSFWDVLAVDPTLFYSGNNKLSKIKIAKAKEKKAFLRCPKCNGNFIESSAIKIFGPAKIR